MKRGKKIALKYCGGCNPGFDRVEFFRKIKSVAGDSIEWVTLEDAGFDAVLLILGCDTACPERSTDFTRYRQIESVKNGWIDPHEVVNKLLSGGRYEDQDQRRLHKEFAGSEAVDLLQRPED